MTTQKVIKCFLNKQKASTPVRDIPNGYWTYRGASIHTDGRVLYSYTTPIAYWWTNDIIKATSHKYSQTTSKQQSTLKWEAYQNDVQLIETPDEITL